MRLPRYSRFGLRASILALLVMAGCESTPQNVESFAPGAYLLGSFSPSPSTAGVHVSAIGLRAQRDQTDGTAVILLDMILQGSEPLVSETANALQYRFFFNAPDYVTIRRQRAGSAIHLDRGLYEDRQDNSFVQFDERVFYKQDTNGRMTVIQPYRIYVTRPPRTGTYTVQLKGDALATALRSINRKFAEVEFDETAQELELSYAELKQ